MALRKASKDEIIVLEEILYSPLRIKIEKLSKNLDLSTDEILPVLEKLLSIELFTIENGELVVDKEKRKYFETLIEKFDEDFRSGYDFLQGLLKNVPIQFLPLWYQIPRSSNNIFESIVEKYLLTPQVFQRYLAEFTSGNDPISEIVNEIYHSQERTLSIDELARRFDMSEFEIYEIVLYLEYSLICTTSYKEDGDHYEEVLSIYPEWEEYLDFEMRSKPFTIADQENVQAYRNREYAFIEDLTQILKISKTHDLETIFDDKKDQWTASKETVQLLSQHIDLPDDQKVYCSKLFNKLLILGLAVIEETTLKPTHIADEWMAMPIEKRAHVIFKHPHNYLAIEKTSPVCTQRSILEIEKSISKASKQGWVYFTDFLERSAIALSDEQKVTLRRVGKQWRYVTPEYSIEQAALIQYTIMEWLFESGIVQIGTHKSRECFKLTSLGNSLFH